VNIYLDAVWTLNFILDLMLLMLTQSLARDHTRKIRLVFGAFIASLLVPFSIYFPNTFFSSILGKFLYSILIILCSFKFLGIYRFVKLLFIFYFVSFSIGGGLIGIHFLFQNPIILSANGFLTFNSGYGDPISWLFVLIGFPIVYLFTKRRMDKHGIDKIRYDQIYNVSIKINHKIFTTSGYIDSGNQLVDPITKYPVIICDENYLKQWFSDDEWNVLKEAHQELDFSKIPKKWEKLIQIVPYQGVEGYSNFLIAMRPEKVIVYYHQNKIVTNKILVGIQFGNLTKDHSYHCLLQPQILTLVSDDSA